MGVELLRVLTASVLTSSIAIVVALLLRRPMRVRFGARIAYALWLMVPLAVAVALLPAPVVVKLVPAVAAIEATPAVSTGAALTPNFQAAPWLVPLWLFGAG